MTSLADVVEVCRRHLHLPDPGALYANLGAIAANRLDADPVWLMTVGPPGSGKTELLGALSRLPEVRPAATMTEAALLSGTPKKERQNGAKGGLLREIGERGVILCKDFGSVLSMNRDARAQVLAALREIYDGSWTRHVGAAGGITLHWQGRIGLLAGATPIIDTHHAVMGSMGERFAFYRMPHTDGDEQAGRAMDNAGNEDRMRAEMSEAVVALFTDLQGFHLPPRDLSAAERKRIIDLANLAVRCRSAVERDPRTREIDLIPEPEAPGRLAGVLTRMLNGMELVGVSPAEAWAVLRKLALDSMPAVRRSVLEHLIGPADHDRPVTKVMTTTNVAEGLQYPTTTARRALEELAAFGVGVREAAGKGGTDRWWVSDWALARWPAESVPTFPETSGIPGNGNGQHGSLSNSSPAERDISGKVEPDFVVGGDGWGTV